MSGGRVLTRISRGCKEEFCNSLSIGGIYKAKWEAFDRDYKKWALEYEKVYLEVLKEERLMKLRAQAKEGHEPQTTAASDKSVERDAPQSGRNTLPPSKALPEE